MHSICDTVLITSDEIPRDLLRDRKIIRFRVVIRFGLTPEHGLSRVFHVLTTCAVRAWPRAEVLSSSKLYSGSDAVPIFPHVLPRLQRGCSSSTTRATSPVSRETTFWRFLAVIKPSSAVWPGLNSGKAVPVFHLDMHAQLHHLASV